MYVTHLVYFTIPGTLCGDFDLTTFYNIGEENKNILFGKLTLQAGSP